MRVQSVFRRRRPSASFVVSVLALFVALGGVGWAATQIPAGSVGTAQLKNRAVTYSKLANGAVGNWKLAFGSVGTRKIQNGAVAKQQINTGQVQARIAGACSQSGQAMATINSSGGVSCATTSPKEFGAASTGLVLVGTSTTQIASKPLPGGSSFLVFGTANAVVTGTVSGQWVRVACTLAPGGAGTAQTSTATVHVTIGKPESVMIPIVLPAGAAANSSTASLGCSYSKGTGTAPTVAAHGTINALQTASNS
jgi:hypothetical protein